MEKKEYIDPFTSEDTIGEKKRREPNVCISCKVIFVIFIL